jgi:hypothetical protein
VLKRSGKPREQQYAERIMPVIRNSHYLLVTLLLCNAASMEVRESGRERGVNNVLRHTITVKADARLCNGRPRPASALGLGWRG